MARKRYEEPDEDDYDPDEDWDDGDDYDPGDPETYPAGLYDDDGPPTVPCPHCRADILEDSEQCPKCGEYISKEDAPGGMSSVLWAVAVLTLLALVLSIVRFG